MTDTEKKLAFLLATSPYIDTIDGKYETAAMDLAANGVVPVVRCKDCKYGVWDEDEEMFRCIEGADYDQETGVYFGFTAYVEADWFCADGERRTDNG